MKAITRDFGSLDQFKTQFATQSAGVQGSGWGWLGLNKATKKLEIATTANQDPLLHLVPLLGVDVWEVKVILIVACLLLTVQERTARLLEGDLFSRKLEECLREICKGIIIKCIKLSVGDFQIF